MKKIFKYAMVGLLGCVTLSSCLESALETSPTDSMSGTDLLANANAALVPLNGIYRSMYTSGHLVPIHTRVSVSVLIH